MLNYLAVDLLVFNVIVRLDWQDIDQLLSHFEIKRQELFDAYAGSSSRVFLVIGRLLSLVVGPMKMQVVIDCKDLGDSCLIEHLMYALGDHAL